MEFQEARKLHNQWNQYQWNQLLKFLYENVVKPKGPHLSYLSPATPKKINKEWGAHVRYEKSARSFDFAIYNKLKN